ncbi:MAG: UvrD-helicase domain-containing protein, partial [Candidatus Parcubacteria bacterium]|nr:UvrD-helicase domain-containing protein [Candidatus Parcubacteria bacterium]
METIEITKNLNPKQRQAVTHGTGPLLIVAGAGTGKTTVITQRMAWLIMSGKAKPEEVLAVTFTDKAAGEMEERVDQLLPYGYVDLWISTFHAFCEKILQSHALDIGLPNNFKVLDTTAQWLLVRQNLDKFNLDYYKPLGNSTKFIHALLSHFSRAKDEAIWPEDYNKWVSGQVGKRSGKGQKKILDDNEIEIKRLKEVAAAYQVYQQLLLDNNYLDFGDLINYTLKLFNDRPKILERYRQQFKYILVDEFQDTNWAQYQLIKLLAAPKNNITVVGDDDQAIYRFRGASLSNILEFKSDYPTAKQVVLVDNYRSAQNILDTAYHFIQHNNPHRLECRLNDDKEMISQAKKKGVKNLALQKIDKKLKAANKTSGVIEHLHYNNDHQEVTGVIRKIVELKKSDHDLQWSDFAILVRANSQAKPFTVALAQAGVPFQFLALRGLYTKEIILDTLAYFKLLDNYHESPALWRVLNFPVFKFSNEDLIQLSHYAYYQGLSLYESLQRAELNSRLSTDAIGEINRLLTLINQHTSLAREKSVSELMVTTLTDLGYIQYLKDHENHGGREQLDYLRQFYEKIKNFEHETDEPKLKPFMAMINLELEAGEEGALQFDIETGPETVWVMTAHASKGLEFQHVFIVNLVQLRFPTAERGEAIELPEDLVKEIVPAGDIHLEEERRLFYVAMTRAKQGLYFTSADDYGGARKKKLSRFLGEIGNLDPVKIDVGEQLTVEAGQRPVQAMEIAPAKLPLPKKFPYSQLSSFNKCPLQYKYAYILKIPTFGKPSFSFGSTIHVTLQKFFQLFSDGGKFPKLEELLKIYEESWIDSWYPDTKTKKTYRDKGRKILTEYYQILKDNQPQPLKLESPFIIKLSGQSISGRIDRIDQTTSGVEIIDYKTGQAKTEVKDDDKDQLLIYQLAAEEAFGLTPSKLTYYYIEANQAVSFIGSEKDKAAIKDKII